MQKFFTPSQYPPDSRRYNDKTECLWRMLTLIYLPIVLPTKSNSFTVR